MEEEKKSSCCWTAATNWIIAHGSLQNIISFESPIEEEEEETAARSKPHLVLKPPPSSDSSPCEINVSFNQKHEVRQVYVRSTARVYEIYYALGQQSSNEYLCTVRCGVAAKEEDILQTVDTGKAAAEDHHAPSKKTPEVPNQTAKSDSTNNSSSDEDGWVEVKGPDSPLLTDTISPMAKEINRSTGIKDQDYYEATAEITDSNPCISITLRLLSLQVKGCVSIEEIYIFAEPVESADDQLGPVESSASSNLLAMLAPSLLQLSKSGFSRVQDRHVSDVREGQKLPGSESINPEVRRTIIQETPMDMTDLRAVKIQAPAEDRTKHRPLESEPQLPHSENVPECDEEEKKLPISHLEKMLGQLDSRVARIEAFCARFEENMLKPINCMATRLQRLEQQLDELTFKSQSPTRLSPCSRIAAPEFLYDESETNSLHAHNNDENVDCASEKEKEDDPSVKTSLPNVDDATTSTISPDLVPHLVVTAPEFSNDDDDEDDNDNTCNDTSEFGMKDNHSVDKRSFSINDALASALASLILSTSTQPPIHSPTLTVKVPDFPNEDDENDGRALPSASFSCQGVKNHTIHFQGHDEMDYIEDSDSIPCTSSSQGGEDQLTKDSPVEEVTAGAARKQLLMGGVQSCRDTTARNLNKLGQTANVTMEESIDGVVSSNQPHMEWFEGNNTDSSFSETVDQNQRTPECANGSRTDTVKVASPNQFCADDSSTDATNKGGVAQLEWNYDCGKDATTKGNIVQDSLTTSTELQSEGDGEDRLDSELIQTSRPVLDFKLPILDVKFISHENSHLKLPLETLLGDVPKIRIQDSSIEGDENDGIANSQKNHLDLGDCEEKKDPMVNDPFLELEDLTVESISPCIQGEKLQDPSASSIEEPFSSLI